MYTLGANYTNYYITTDKAVICLDVYIYIWMHQVLFSCFLVLFGCIDAQYLNIALILNTETTLNQNFLTFIFCLDLLKTYCWCYHFDMLIFPISKVYSSFTITVYMNMVQFGFSCGIVFSTNTVYIN
jgi:hypothetical protein